MARILIVDDDPDIREILRAFLPRHTTGHTYAFAESALEAQALMLGARETGQKFDLVLTDIQMPKMSGCDFARWIRGEYADDDVLILFLTAFGYSDEIEDCAKDVRVVANLTKPDDLMELGGCIDSALLAAQ